MNKYYLTVENSVVDGCFYLNILRVTKKARACGYVVEIDDDEPGLRKTGSDGIWDRCCKALCDAFENRPGPYQVTTATWLGHRSYGNAVRRALFRPQTPAVYYAGHGHESADQTPAKHYKAVAVFHNHIATIRSLAEDVGKSYEEPPKNTFSIEEHSPRRTRVQATNVQMLMSLIGLVADHGYSSLIEMNLLLAPREPR